MIDNKEGEAKVRLMYATNVLKDKLEKFQGHAKIGLAGKVGIFLHTLRPRCFEPADDDEEADRIPRGPLVLGYFHNFVVPTVDYLRTEHSQGASATSSLGSAPIEPELHLYVPRSHRELPCLEDQTLRNTLKEELIGRNGSIEYDIQAIRERQRLVYRFRNTLTYCDIARNTVALKYDHESKVQQDAELLLFWASLEVLIHEKQKLTGRNNRVWKNVGVKPLQEFPYHDAFRSNP